MLAYILSKPDDWTIRMSDLYNESPAGRSAVDRMMRELIQHGYVRRHRSNNDLGYLEWVTEVYEDRTQNPEYQPKAENQTIGRDKEEKPAQPKAEKTTIGKPSNILSTENKPSTELVNPNGLTNGVPPPVQFFDEKGNPTKDHPAIKEYRRVIQKYPSKNQWHSIVSYIGPNPKRIELYGQVLQAFIDLDWNHRMIKLVANWVNRGTIPDGQGAEVSNSRHRNGAKNGTTVGHDVFHLKNDPTVTII